MNCRDALKTFAAVAAGGSSCTAVAIYDPTMHTKFDPQIWAAVDAIYDYFQLMETRDRNWLMRVAAALDAKRVAFMDETAFEDLMK
jgi:hypothetical protein